MNLIRVEKNQVGLLIKNGDFKKVLAPGRYWAWNRKDFHIFNLNMVFLPPVPLEELLANETFAAMADVVAVKQHEIALVFENDLLKMNLLPGRYAFLKGNSEMKFQVIDVSGANIINDLPREVLFHPMLQSMFRNYIVAQHEKAVLLVDGKFHSVLDSGVYSFYVNSHQIELKKADMRMQALEISGQEILTKDKAALRINAFAQYNIADINKAVLENKEMEKQLYVLVQLVLREYIGTLGLDELLEKKGQVGKFMLEQIREEAATLGVTINGFGVRDIILPGDVKEIMNQVLVAEKKAQANLIMRREETASTRSLMNTAKLMEENPMLFRLKEMEYVERIAEKVGSINVNGGGLLGDQLRQIFTPK
ncbi:slipin family protein [Chitinophaga sp. Cy-1792]|uniref:slipin family protein n=1 Tax=Chitinophaga sp. Cy-1792 TaxID=2608339 RepID=UPI001420D622|nr:slipin family protein [Chitinophaga sp. Cy-1792]NIG54947.1 slipin family protein [Chitinophaga sp. Cy-1792]